MATVDDLAARLATLEARLGPMPTAAVPPIRIGELTDVPTPGSPIASAWPQEVTNRCRHRFPNVANRDTNWPAATAGAGATCVTLDSNTTWFSNGTLWVSSSGIVASGGGRGNDQNMNTGSPWVVNTVTIAPMAAATRVQASVAFWFGFSGTVNQATVSVQLSPDASVVSGPGTLTAPANTWHSATMLLEYPVPANAPGGFVARISPTNFGGGSSCWGAAYVLWTQRAA